VWSSIIEIDVKLGLTTLPSASVIDPPKNVSDDGELFINPAVAPAGTVSRTTPPGPDVIFIIGGTHLTSQLVPEPLIIVV
jgi:hypothetical protein